MDEVEKEKRVALLRAKLRRFNGEGKTRMIVEELYKLKRNEH